MRSNRRGSPDFGSDSFLDILANVVGVLIIFILIAGIKARNAPVVVEQTENIAQNFAMESIRPPEAQTNRPKEIPRPYRELAAPLPAIEHEEGRQLNNELQIAISDSRQAQAAAIHLQNEIRISQSQRKRLKNQLDTLVGISRQQTEKTANLSHAFSKLEKEIGDFEEQKRKLLFRFDEAHRKAESATRVIRHRLNPVSKLVNGKEIHFHLSNDKIAHVPVEKLIDRMKKQIQRQQNWILKFKRHRGRVGPERGFVMSYIVQRENPSVLNRLQSGYGLVRISLTEWRIDAEYNIGSENAKQALARGSKFLQEIRAADPDATLTFWVYPDSFALYRQLEKFVHREGYRVAARPLPFGVPIAGSPNGTRSAGQ